MFSLLHQLVASQRRAKLHSGKGEGMSRHIKGIVKQYFLFCISWLRASGEPNCTLGREREGAGTLKALLNNVFSSASAGCEPAESQTALWEGGGNEQAH